MTDTDKNEVALEARESDEDRLFSPSAARNRDAIRDAFTNLMPSSGKILEIAGGTGEHAVHIASGIPELDWLTGDPDETARRSIAGWIAASALPNLRGPHKIDVTAPLWGVEDEAPFDGLVCINMVHIAPFEAARGLFAGARRLLGPNGKLFLYGPFSRKGRHTAPSNAAFDESLKSRNTRWGVRDLEQEIAPLGEENALHLERVVEMPANNLTVVFGKV